MPLPLTVQLAGRQKTEKVGPGVEDDHVGLLLEGGHPAVEVAIVREAGH